MTPTSLLQADVGRINKAQKIEQDTDTREVRVFDREDIIDLTVDNADSPSNSNSEDECATNDDDNGNTNTDDIDAGAIGCDAASGATAQLKSAGVVRLNYAPVDGDRNDVRWPEKDNEKVVRVSRFVESSDTAFELSIGSSSNAPESYTSVSMIRISVSTSTALSDRRCIGAIRRTLY